MKKMTKQKKVFILLIWVLPMLNLAWSLPARAENYRSFHADDLFEKTMAVLKETMAQAREGNDEFMMQNGKLQDAIDTLEQAIADAVAEKTQLKREALRLTDEITLVDKENALFQQRLKNFTTRKARLVEDNESIQKRLQILQADNQQARTIMAELKEEISRLAVNSPPYQKPTKQKGNSNLAARLVAQKKRVGALEERLAYENKRRQNKGQPGDATQKQNSVLRDRVTAMEGELSKAREQANLLRREGKATDSMATNSGQELRAENAELRAAADDMKESLTDLRRAAAKLKPGQGVQIKNLEKSLKKVQQQHNRLNQRLARVAPHALPRVARMEEYDNLLVRKKALLRDQSDLKNKIAEFESQPSSHEAMAPAKGVDYQAELAKSQVRVAKLQDQIASWKNTPAQAKNAINEKLSSQVASSEKQLAMLRSEKIRLTLPVQPSLSPAESAKTQAVIDQLKSRRAILAESLKAIDSKYDLTDLTAKGRGTPETQLQDYLQVLSNENSALQEKLLILQMQQDKKVPPP